MTRTIVYVWMSILLAGLASAQGTDWDERDRRDDGSALAIRVGVGFTADPSTFLIAFELPYSLTRDFSLGPLVQIGVDDRETLVGATLNARYSLHLGQRDSQNDFLSQLVPFVQGGLGLVHLDRDLPFGDVDDTAFLMNVGFGVDFPISDTLSVGSHIMFNVVPGDVLNENFFFSWQLLAAQFRF